MGDHQSPLIWAHRGASGEAPENTLASFELAAKQGADGVELDVQMSADGVLVICHDEKVDRTANAKGWLKDYSFDALRRMDFSYGKLQYEGERIPTLEEVLDLLDPTDLTMNIELKTGIFFYPGIEEKVIGLVEKKCWQERVIFSSFNHYSVDRVGKLAPWAKRGILYMDGPIDVPAYAKRLGVEAVHPALYNLQYPGFPEACAKEGLDINVWTVDEYEYMKLCRQMGVHAIITDYPKKAKEFYAADAG
ncbi:MAG: glycerophosphodiester phosphodiesterase [Lachnospiraceae bacterium]|nr:glycerophosphodiester phosphodiesterase [Lachnospiraceae bacterium]